MTDITEYIELYSIFKSFINYPSNKESDILHMMRCQGDPFIFKFLERKYGEELNDFWTSYKIPLDSDKAIVIVERRCHPNFEFCLKNAVYFARGFSVHIFCSQSNLEYIKYICRAQKENIHIHILFDSIGTPEQGKYEYNELLKQKEFWNILNEEIILTIETDSYLLDFIPESIYKYDYVSSKWPWLPTDPGGGGLSLRKRSKILQICDVKQVISGGAQDAYISEGIKELGYSYPSFDESSEYFTECLYSMKAIGTHQWWTFLILNRNENQWIQWIHKYCTLNINRST